MNSYGTATFTGKEWHFDVVPHAAMRLKRWLPRLNTESRTLKVKAAPDVAADIAAFVERYPLDIRPPNALREQLAKFRSREAQMRAVLSGAANLDAPQMVYPPRDYQRQAAALALASGGLLLGDELGLGKTVSAMTLLSAPGTLPALVVVPAHMALQWQRELGRFLPMLNVHILKKSAPYDLPSGWHVLIATYHKLSGWAAALTGHISTVVFDECQDLRRGGSNKYDAARAIADGAKCRLGLSGTPVYNYGGELWCIADVLRPGELGSFAEFSREWGDGSSDPSKLRVKDSRALGAYLRDAGLFLRRTKADVGQELPRVERIVHEVDMEAAALRRVESRAAELAKIVLSQAERFDRMRAGGELSTALRMATGIGKARYVAAFVRMLLEQGEGPVILCGWHREVYGIWQEELADMKPAWLTGSESPTQKQASVDAFIGGDTDLLIMSLRSGAGVDGLQKRCSRIVFGELDWSPGVHGQCIGRLDREGQTEPVFAYFLVGDNGCDPIMVDILGLKTEQAAGIQGIEDALAEQIDPDHIKRLAAAYLQRTGQERAA